MAKTRKFRKIVEYRYNIPEKTKTNLFIYIFGNIIAYVFYLVIVSPIRYWYEDEEKLVDRKVHWEEVK